MVLLFGVLVGCSSGSSDPGVDDGFFDLGDRTGDEAKFALMAALKEGHVLHVVESKFIEGGVYVRTVSVPEHVRSGYPDTVIVERWETADAQGDLDTSIQRMSEVDGRLLAVLSDGMWEDVASGDTWQSFRENPETEFDLTNSVAVAYRNVSNRLLAGQSATPGTLLGKKSFVFSPENGPVVPTRATEYQGSNPMIYRDSIWKVSADGEYRLVSEDRTLEFELLPVGFRPEF
jgi:hypothetical protein